MTERRHWSAARERTSPVGGQADPSRRFAGLHIQTLAELGDLDPGFLAACEAIYGHPYRQGALSPRDRALIVVAAETAIPQADEARIAAALTQVRDCGGTRDEVMCVLEISSSLGLHTVSVGLPILLEEMTASGIDLPPETARHAELRQYIETAGPRPRPLNPIYAGILRMDPDYFEARIHFIDLPWEREDVLDQRLKHLASIAIDAISPQHYADGLRKHVHEALGHGVTAADILEVLQLASVTSLRTLDAALPLVAAIFPLVKLSWTTKRTA
jgi:alkylhydroperoxidase/carboxymuconolactone decarboxylase family protein YurZ